MTHNNCQSFRSWTNQRYWMNLTDSVTLYCTLCFIFLAAPFVGCICRLHTFPTSRFWKVTITIIPAEIPTTNAQTICLDWNAHTQKKIIHILSYIKSIYYYSTIIKTVIYWKATIPSATFIFIVQTFIR